MDKILAYGEIMLRISSYVERIDNNYTIGYGGCEANALIFLGQRKHNCEFLSSFPDNFIGRYIELFLKKVTLEKSYGIAYYNFFLVAKYNRKMLIFELRKAFF